MSIAWLNNISLQEAYELLKGVRLVQGLRSKDADLTIEDMGIDCLGLVLGQKIQELEINK